MIAGLARAARRLGRAELAAAATRAVDFIRARALARRPADGHVQGRPRALRGLPRRLRIPRSLGLLELLQCRWRGGDLDLRMRADGRAARALRGRARRLLLHRRRSRAADPQAETVRRRGSAVGQRRGRARARAARPPARRAALLDAAERTLRAALHAIERYPEGHATLLHALEELLAPPQIVVVRADERALPDWRGAADAGFPPHRLAFAIPTTPDAPLRGLLAERAPRGPAVAYVCEGTPAAPRSPTSPPSPPPSPPNRRVGRAPRRLSRRAPLRVSVRRQLAPSPIRSCARWTRPRLRSGRGASRSEHAQADRDVALRAPRRARADREPAQPAKVRAAEHLHVAEPAAGTAGIAVARRRRTRRR